MPPKKKSQRNPDKTIENTSTPAKEIRDVSSIADLRPAGYNPRHITAEKLKMLRDALREFGDLGGVVFNVRTGRLVGGHQRVKNLDLSWPIIKEAITDSTGTVASGYIETPDGRFNYREVDWTEQKEKAANIAANKHGGEFDDDLLAQLMQELVETGYDMNLTGFDQAEIDELLGLNKPEPTGDEDAVVEPVEEPFVKLGDLWLCGESRILCGDSTSIADVDKLLMGEKVDLCVTDPPYGIAYEAKAGKIENDDLKPTALLEFLKAAFSVMEYALKPGACWYCWHADGGELGKVFRDAIAETKNLLNKATLIWVKSSATLCRSDFNAMHEGCLYGWKAGSAHYFSGDHTLTTVIDDDVDISKMDKKQLQTLVNELRQRVPSTVIRVDKPSKNIWHPTVKPVRLFERSIYASSRPGAIVLDLFSGSGTMVVACRKMGRKGRGMELSPHYLQSSLLRYFEYCQEEPKLLNPDGTMTPYSEVEKQRKQKAK
jgi:DNA modification methylase